MSLLTIRMQITIQTVLVLCVLACSVQTFAQALPGIGTVNHLAVDVIKVTTNPTDPKDTADINGPVGGDSVSIYVKVQYGNVITSINSVTVNIHEFGVSTVVGSLSLTTYTQLADSGSGEATLHTRVYTGTWNTLTTTPLIYNANYCFKATVDYDRNSAHASPAVDSDEVSVPVKNLVIESIAASNTANPPSNPDEFFVVLAGQTQHVTFKVTLDDYSTTRSYSYQLTISRTMDNQTIVKHITQTGTGLSKTLDWDLTDDNNQPAVANGGYCTYDLSVTAGTDTVNYRSTNISVSNDDVSLATDSDGNVIMDGDGNYTALLKYRLNEAPYSASVKAVFLENLVEKATVSGMSLQEQGYTGAAVSASVSLDPPPSIRGILCAKDNRASEYREKLPRRMLCANGGWATYTHNVLFTFNLVGEGNHPGYLTEWQWVYGPPTTPGGPITNTSPAWIANRHWEANSGNGTYLNSYTVRNGIEDYWISHRATPVSCCSHNTVHENEITVTRTGYSGGTVHRCYIIKNNRGNYGGTDWWMTSAQYAAGDEKAGFAWCNAETTLDYTPNNDPKEFDDPSKPSEDYIYRLWRFDIRNLGGGDAHTRQGGGGNTRSLLRVHEDGHTPRGSIGCIAVRPGSMEGINGKDSVWTRLNNILNACTNYHGTIGIPLEVYQQTDIHASKADSSWAIFANDRSSIN